MPQSINYKNKYIELRTKYIADIDVAFRLGFEAGAQQAQQQQAMEAQAQAQEAEQRMAEAEAAGMNGQPPGAGGPPGQPGGAPGEGVAPPGQPAEGGQPPGAPQAGAPNPNGSELDQHINKLEGMLGSSASPEVKKSLQDIISLRKAEKLAYEISKGDAAINGIVKALHKPAFKLSAQANHNLSNDAKNAVSLQHKIVNDVFKSWQEEEKKAPKDIASILSVEGLLTKG